MSIDVVALFAQWDANTWWRALSAFLLCALVIPLTLPLAHRLGWHDHPGGRKCHEAPTAITGGLVIFIAVAATTLIFDNVTSRYAAFLIGGGLLVLIGLADDRRDLRWYWRIGAQALAALAMIYLGGQRAEQLGDVVGLPHAYLGWLAVPFTVFVVVGVINAINMIDGVDGLAGGQVLVALLLYACFALYSGNELSAERLLALAAAVAGFLVWNARWPWQGRARVFLGNAGSMLLGFVIAWYAVRLTQDARHPVSPVLGPWVVAIPLLDCVALMFRRLRQGRSPFAADRDHVHHLLLDAGFRAGTVAVGLTLLSLLIGFGAALAVKVGVYRPLMVLLFLVVLAWWYRFSYDRERAVAVFRGWRARWVRVEQPA